MAHFCRTRVRQQFSHQGAHGTTKLDFGTATDSCIQTATTSAEKKNRSSADGHSRRVRHVLSREKACLGYCKDRRRKVVRGRGLTGPCDQPNATVQLTRRARTRSGAKICRTSFGGRARTLPSKRQTDWPLRGTLSRTSWTRSRRPALDG